MNRSNLVRLVLAAALACAAGGLRSQQALEIIPLRHRTVEQVLPALQPLLEPGATLSGNRGQLFLRASPANAADIKRALEAIDRPLRRLQISVRFDDTLERERRGVGVSGSVGSGGARIGVSAEDSRRAAAERVDQRLQVLEGGRARIFAGEHFGTGFEVVPRVAGQNVFLEIVGQRATQGLATSVSARLGEWVELGGTAESAARDERGLASAGRAHAAQSRRVWVKVEELAN